jgi:hypothetical protein
MIQVMIVEESIRFWTTVVVMGASAVAVVVVALYLFSRRERE